LIYWRNLIDKYKPKNRTQSTAQINSHANQASGVIFVQLWLRALLCWWSCLFYVRWLTQIMLAQYLIQPETLSPAIWVGST